MTPPLDEPLLVGRINDAANAIVDPCSVAQGIATGLGDMGLVDDIDITHDVSGRAHARVRLRLTSPGCMYQLYFEQQLALRLAAIEELSGFVVDWSDRLDWEPSDMAPHAQQALARRRDALREASARRWERTT